MPDDPCPHPVSPHHDRPDAARELVRAARGGWRGLAGLHHLLEQRPELRGVHDRADLLAEAQRWSA